jgi:hypothetical protein
MSRLLDRRYKRILFVLLAGILGMVISCLAVAAFGRTTYGSWQQLPQPPVSLDHFVAGRLTDASQGEIVAATADGTLYALPCPDLSCQWSKRDGLPPVVGESQPGLCPQGSGPDAEVVANKPKVPGRVVDGYETRYCRTSYDNTDLHYVLLEDGSVWVWEWAEHGRSGYYANVTKWLAMVIFGAIGVIVGLLAGIIVVVLAIRRSRSVP